VRRIPERGRIGAAFTHLQLFATQQYTLRDGTNTILGALWSSFMELCDASVSPGVCDRVLRLGAEAVTPYT
jgi:hypothetical protein